MSKPFHVIATPDENGYTVTIPENPNVSARCADAADIVPTATAAKEQDEHNPVFYMLQKINFCVFQTYILYTTHNLKNGYRKDSA